MQSTDDYLPTFFFIPDISGFTSFVNEVEINHSTHIISELLEVIMSANILGLYVAELEGDAVFFYRTGPSPSLTEVLEQSEKMYKRFHRHLKYYERDRICQCGACSTAHDLTLKFVGHYGHATARKIGQFNKLFGSDVTLVHKLLKNNIPSSEYLLFTSSEDVAKNTLLPYWAQLEQERETYVGIGEVAFQYIPLAPLKSEVGTLEPRTQFHRYGRPVKVSRQVTVPMKLLHGVVTDLSLRSKWIFGLQLIKEHGNLTPAIGDKHLCILPTHAMEFVITAQHIKEGIVEYVEQSNSIPFLAPLNVVFEMTRVTESKSAIAIHIHYKKNRLTEFRLDFPLRLMMRMIAWISLQKLQRYLVKGQNVKVNVLA